MKIGIAGAGLLGRLLAFELSRLGHQLHLFDAAPDARTRVAAGWSAAGMLSPVAELECADETVFALGLRSLELWPRIVQKLDAPVELRREGSLLLAHRGDEGAARRTLELLQRRVPPAHQPRQLAREQLSGLEPAVHGPAHAWLLPCEGSIDTVQAMTAIAAGAEGAQWHWDNTVTRVAAGEIAVGHDRHAFDWVFDVRGVGARPQLPVRGVRGEIFRLHAPGLGLRRPLRLLHPRYRVYIVPRADGHVMVGASEIESEDRSPVSLRSTVELLAAAHSVVPGLAEARIVHSEVNLRPALPDNLPLLASEEGLTRINGLFRHGWLIAPALVEDAIAFVCRVRARAREPLASSQGAS